MANTEKQALLSALEWSIEAGADEALAHSPVDSTKTAAIETIKGNSKEETRKTVLATTATQNKEQPEQPPLGTSEAKEESTKRAQQAKTLDDLREAIATFDGLDVKKTAANLVFGNGHQKAPIMLIGEAPGADDDKQGSAFTGPSGQLLDKIFACIDIDRHSEDPKASLYVSNILNWRPPGNRTPTAGEIEIALPFIERHIALIKPKILILCGGIPAKTLLKIEGSISRLRGQWHLYKTQTPGIDSVEIPALATYHPAHLLQTPSQKRAVWQDILTLQEKRRDLGLLPDTQK